MPLLSYAVKYALISKKGNILFLHGQWPLAVAGCLDLEATMYTKNKT